MDVNKTLISTAMLTAIFEKTKKSNIDLIAPFVLFIISKIVLNYINLLNNDCVFFSCICMNFFIMNLKKYLLFFI